MVTAYDVIQQAYKELGNDSQKYWDWYFQDNKPYCENTIFSRQACFVSWLLTKCAVVCPNFPRASVDDLDINTDRLVDSESVSIGDIAVFYNEIGIVTWLDDTGGLYVVTPSIFTGVVDEHYRVTTARIDYCFRPYYRNKV